jgi:hypothetical protein
MKLKGSWLSIREAGLLSCIEYTCTDEPTPSVSITTVLILDLQHIVTLASQARKLSNQCMALLILEKSDAMITFKGCGGKRENINYLIDNIILWVILTFGT